MAKTKYFDIETCSFDIFDKKQNQRYMLYQMLDRTQEMFKWEGWEEDINLFALERDLQTNGYVFVTDKIGGKLNFWRCAMSGVPDKDLIPTQVVISNPTLSRSYTFDVSKDGVLIKNDSYKLGLIPIIARNTAIISESEISLVMAIINKRVQVAFACEDDIQKQSCEKFIKDLIRGELSCLLAPSIIDGIKALPMTNATGQAITEIIETIQYEKASLFNDLGINANYNMKREAINSVEAQLGNGSLLPFVDNMLRCREQAVEKINKMYGTNISCVLASAWKNEQEKQTQEVEPTKTEDVEPNPTQEGEQQ